MIKVTDTTGNDWYININHVIAIYRSATGGTWTVIMREEYEISVSYSEARKLLKWAGDL